MGRRRCCCGSCLIGSDGFDRADSDDPGSRWHEISPADWRIKDNRLECVVEGPLMTTYRQVSTRRFLCSACAKYPTQSYFTLTGIEDGITEWGVIVGFRDASNFYWIKFELDAEDQIWPSFMERSGGVDTSLLDVGDYDPDDQVLPFTLDDDGDLRIVVCYAKQDWTVGPAVGDENAWTISAEGGEEQLPDPLPDETRVGHFGFLMGYFENWSYYRHWEALPICDWCACFCKHPDDDDDIRAFPETLHLTLIPDENNAFACPGMDNRTLELNQGVWDEFQDRLEERPYKTTWTTDNDVGFPDPPHGEGSTQTFTCPETLLLTGSSLVQLLGDADWSQSTCNPLYLVFPQVWSTGSTQCDDMIHIRSELCPGMDCVDDTPENQALIGAMKWTPVLTN